MTKKTLFILLGLLITAGIFASDSELTGKDVAAKGSVRTLEGIFEMEDGEWYLRTKDRYYSIHKGPDWYTEEVGFIEPEGKQVVIEGFVLGHAISPCTITIEDTRYAFRSLEGQPLWSGRGNRSNSSSEHECEHGCENEHEHE